MQTFEEVQRGNSNRIHKIELTGRLLISSSLGLCEAPGLFIGLGSETLCSQGKYSNISTSEIVSSPRVKTEVGDL